MTMNERINLHVWKSNSPEVLEELGFTQRDGYYDKFVETQMDKHYMKVYINDYEQKRPSRN